MGGTNALQAVGKAAKSTDAQLQDISSRLLGEWMTEDAAPVLLELAKIPSNPYQVRALRGYIRIARQLPFCMDMTIKISIRAISMLTSSAPSTSTPFP